MQVTQLLENKWKKKKPRKPNTYVEKYKSNNSRTNLNDSGMATLVSVLIAISTEERCQRTMGVLCFGGSYRPQRREGATQAHHVEERERDSECQ